MTNSTTELRQRMRNDCSELVASFTKWQQPMTQSYDRCGTYSQLSVWILKSTHFKMGYFKLCLSATRRLIMYLVFTAWAYARAVLGVVILSVCLSHVLIVTNPNDALQIFWYHTKGQPLLLWHQQWLVGDASFTLKSALKVTHPLRKTPTLTDFRL